MSAAKRVFRYLKNTKSCGTTYRLDVDDFPPNTGDSSIATGLVDQTRAAVLLAIFSSSTKRSFPGHLSVSRLGHFLPQRPSMLQALLRFKKILFFRKSVNNLGFPQPGHTPVFADNDTSIAWSEAPVGGSDRAKHLDLRVHCLHGAVKAGELVLLMAQPRRWSPPGCGLEV